MNNKKIWKGSVLPYALVIMTTVTIILVSVMQYIVSQTNYGHYEAAREEAFQVSEAGVNFYRWYLAKNLDGKTTQQMNTFWATGNPIGVATPYEADYYDSAGNVVGRYRLEVTPPSSGTASAILKATAWTTQHPDSKRVITVRFRKPAWSEYVLLGNDFQRFGSGTDIKGKIFSNGGVHFDGVAINVVYSAVNTYYDSDSDVRSWKPGVWTSWPNEYNSEMHSNVFLAGKVYPVTEKSFTAISASLSSIKTEAKKPNGNTINNCTATGCYFDNSNQGRHIILNSNGTFNIRKVKSSNGSSNDIHNYQDSWQTFTIPNGGVIFVEDNVWLEGTINNKQVTVVAANLQSSNYANVYIKNDIRYTNYDGRDILGIIAQEDIEVIEDSEDDLRIDGALLAQEGRVGRENYGNNDHKDTITIFGAVATNQRYGFAYTDGTGYENRNLYFDNTLLNTSPPFFPTGTSFFMDEWNEL